MKLLDVLKKVVLEDDDSKLIILEIAEKLRQRLLEKFRNETQDSDEEILRIIDLFDRYKGGFPSDKRDIMVFMKPENTYDILKSIISSKEASKQVDNLYTEFKKKDPKVPNDVKKHIKRFLEIESELPEERKNVLDFEYLSLIKFLDDVYSKLIHKKLIQKFSSEQVTKEQLQYYIGAYLDNLNRIPLDAKRVDQMTFSEFEHLLDGLPTDDTKPKTQKNDYEGIDLIYDQNNLKIFAPKTKDQCIRLKNGRSWCTSREGAGNMYYNYRLNSRKTLYYVIDEDKDFNDTNFAVVVLVDPQGNFALADKSNSGKFGGSTDIPWSEIISKVPKLRGLQNLFVPSPLSEEEVETMKKVKNIRVGDNPYESLGDERYVEIWLEYLSPKLTDIQYSNLSIPLKKKYIALGMDLTPGQVNYSEPEVLKYYSNKKVEIIRNKSLKQLTDSEIALLNSSLFRKMKQDLKSKFTSELSLANNDPNKLIISYPSDDLSKYLALYNMDSLFQLLKDENKISQLEITNYQKQPLNIIVSDLVGEMTNLTQLKFINCIDRLPDSLGNLQNLEFLILSNNPKLTKLPESLSNLSNLNFVNILGTNIQAPEWLRSNFTEWDSGMWLRN